jgi:hypothetical protein
MEGLIILADGEDEADEPASIVSADPPLPPHLKITLSIRSRARRFIDN